MDYKFWYITKRTSDNKILEAGVRFYEGDDVTETINDPIEGEKTVTRYKRTKKLDKSEVNFLAGKKTKKDSNNLEVAVFDSSDFGDIYDEDELRAFLNKEMKKDTTRDNIPEQVEEDVAVLKTKTKGK